MAFKIEIKGIEKLAALGKGLTEKFQASASLAPVRTEIGRIVSDSNRRSFEGERSADGQRWPPRAAGKGGRRIINRKPLLVATGRFKAALLAPSTRVDDFGRRLTVTYASDETDLLKFHNFGTRRGLPPRPVGLQLDRQAQEEINAVAVKKIRESFAKALKK